MKGEGRIWMFMVGYNMLWFDLLRRLTQLSNSQSLSDQDLLPSQVDAKLHQSYVFLIFCHLPVCGSSNLRQGRWNGSPVTVMLLA